MSLDTLYQIAHFSKFHFHRQFTGYTGITVNRFIQLMRLKRATYRLAFDKDQKIIDIALDAQFENPESFSRAFKQASALFMIIQKYPLMMSFVLIFVTP